MSTTFDDNKNNKDKKLKKSGGDQRIMDAADTLVSLAHSTTPTENKQIIELIKNENNDLKMKNEFRIKSPTQACRVIEQILKTCTNSTITIKTNNNTETTTTTIATSSSPSTNNNNNNNKRSNSLSSSSMNTSSVSTSADEEDSQCSFTSSTYNEQQQKNQNGGSKSKRVKYGPIQVKPRDKAAPTLATGRKSKDYELPPEEARKREERRMRNKEAAAKCRRKREEIANELHEKTEQLRNEQDKLAKTFELLKKEKQELENLLKLHEKKCLKKNNNQQQQQQKGKPNNNDNNILTQIPILTFNNNNNNPISTAVTSTTTTTTSSNALIDNLKQKTKKLDENNNNNEQLMSKFDDDDNVKIKNENPMISGQQQRDSIIERPKNLNIPLSCMLFTRQDSSMFAQPNTGCFNSPTFPIFAITPIEALHSAALLASPSMLTPTLSNNTTTSSSSSTTTTTTTTTSNTLNTPQTHVAFAILKSFS